MIGEDRTTKNKQEETTNERRNSWRGGFFSRTNEGTRRTSVDSEIPGTAPNLPTPPLSPSSPTEAWFRREGTDYRYRKNSTSDSKNEEVRGSFSSKIAENILLRDLKELGMDVNNDNWKDNLKAILEKQENFQSLVNTKVQLLSKLAEKEREKFQIEDQLARLKKNEMTLLIREIKEPISLWRT